MSAPRAAAEGAWQPLLRAVLASWHGAGPAEEVPEPLRPVLERLEGQPEESRAALLELLGRRLERPALPWIHPTWLAGCLPADPLLRSWLLGALPLEVRHGLLRALEGLGGEEGAGGAPVALACQPPDWLAGWWQGEVETRLGYPRPLPWLARADAAPLGWLFRLSPRDLARLLQFHGLHPLAAALEAWGLQRPREEVVQVAFGLPEPLRQRLVELSREGGFDEAAAEAWGERLAALGGAGAPAREEPLPALLALDDLAANAAAWERTEDAVRIAYRLPAALGAELLARLDEDLEDLEELAAPDPEEWDRRLAGEIEDLAARGLIRLPEPEEGLP